MSWQTVSLPFGAGLDTKTDSKMLAPPKLTTVQDAVFTNFKRLTKRNGYTDFTLNISGGGTITNPTLVKSYNNELVVAANNSNGGTQRLYSFSEMEQAWIDKGPYVSVAVSNQEIASNTNATSPSSLLGPEFGFFNANSVTYESLILTVCESAYPYSSGNDQAETFGQSNLGYVYFNIQDVETGTYVIYQYQITGANSGPYCVFAKPILLAGNQFAIIYVNTHDYTNPSLVIRLIGISGGVVSVTAEGFIGQCSSSSGLNVQYPYCYDVVTTSSGAALAVSNGNDLLVYSISSSGSATLQATLSFMNPYVIPIHCSVDGSGNIWIYWCIQNSGNNTWFVAAFPPTYGSFLLSPTQIKSVLSGVTATQIAAISVDGNHQQVWLSWQTTGGVANIAIFPTYTVLKVSLTGNVQVLTNPNPNQCLDIYGRPFFVGGNLFIPAYSYSQSQSTGYILDASNNLPVAKFQYQALDGIYQGGFSLDAASAVQAPLMLSGRYPGFLSNSLSLSSTLVGLATNRVSQLTFYIQPVAAVTNASVFSVSQTNSAFPSLNFSEFDFANIDSNQAIVSQETLVLNGGVMQMYDGGRTSEVGWNYDPDNLSAVPETSGGSMSSGVYEYTYTNVWVDANGNEYESAPSNPVTVVFTTGSSNSVKIAVPNPYQLTNKLVNLTGTQIVQKIWRTDSNTGTTQAYLVACTASVSTGPIQCRFITDTLSTAQLTVPGAQTLYTGGFPPVVLENISPPPANIVWTNNNRVWCVDAENPSTTIEYSKTGSPGSGILFSYGQLEYLFDSKQGNVMGAAPMDEKTVILKQNGVAYFIGDGDNDAGTGSTLTPLQFIPSDTGCSNSKSVIVYPNGVLFRANNNKGIYLVSRGLQVGYFGLDVNKYNNQDIQAAQFDGNKNQIRFLTSSGLSLVYDYVMQQWGTFTNHTGLSSTVWQGNYVYIRASGGFSPDQGHVYVEDQSGTYLDNTTPYAPLIQTAFIKATVIQNFERIRRLLLLGDCQGFAGHGVQIQVAYDFQPASLPPVPYTFVTTPYQYRQRMSRQKADALQFIIQEIVTGASGEFIDFSDLGLEIQSKTGLNKLPGSSSVG